MKKIILVFALFLSQIIVAQTNIGEVVTYAIEDITKFGKAYISPAAQGVMYNVNNGWYNKASTNDFLEVEVNLIGNLTFVKCDKNSFTVNTNEYNNIRFQDGAITKEVATIFGINNPDVIALIDYETDQGVESLAVELPQGIDDGEVNSAPNVFLQASVGLIKGTELKVRFAPEVNYGDVKKKLYGFGLQHEITSWLAKENKFPLHLSALVGYTKFNGFYDIKESGEQSTNQGIDSEMGTWAFSLIASTNFSKLNFYGGIGYLTATAETKFKGVYEIAEGNEQFQDLLDNYTVTNKVDGFNATLGANLNLGAFHVNTAFNIQEFYNITLGIGYTFNQSN